MTNRLSILGEVNGDGDCVYGDSEKLGGFRAKMDFRLRISDFGFWEGACRAGAGSVFGGVVA
jgi:hypothetical protein